MRIAVHWCYSDSWPQLGRRRRRRRRRQDVDNVNTADYSDYIRFFSLLSLLSSTAVAVVNLLSVPDVFASGWCAGRRSRSHGAQTVYRLYRRAPLSSLAPPTTRTAQANRRPPSTGERVSERFVYGSGKG